MLLTAEFLNITAFSILALFSVLLLTFLLIFNHYHANKEIEDKYKKADLNNKILELREYSHRRKEGIRIEPFPSKEKSG